MKLIIGSLLFVALLGFKSCTAQRYNYTYGVGANGGLNYSGSREVGFHLKNGTYSAFTGGTFVPNAYGDAGVFVNPPGQASQPAIPQQPQAPPRYAPYPYPYPAPVGPPNYPVQGYPYQPQGVPQYLYNYAAPTRNPQ